MLNSSSVCGSTGGGARRGVGGRGEAGRGGGSRATRRAGAGPRMRARARRRSGVSLRRTLSLISAAFSRASWWMNCTICEICALTSASFMAAGNEAGSSCCGFGWRRVTVEVIGGGRGRRVWAGCGFRSKRVREAPWRKGARAHTRAACSLAHAGGNRAAAASCWCQACAQMTRSARKTLPVPQAESGIGEAQSARGGWRYISAGMRARAVPLDARRGRAVGPRGAHSGHCLRSREPGQVLTVVCSLQRCGRRFACADMQVQQEVGRGWPSGHAPRWVHWRESRLATLDLESWLTDLRYVRP